MKIGMELKHRKCLEILKEAGIKPPAIPKGKKIVWKHFKTIDGFPALAVNQTGIVPELRDNEEEVNGLSVMIALVEDLDNCPNAPATLQRAFFTLIEATDDPVELSVVTQEHGLTGKPGNARSGDAPLTDKASFVMRSGYKAKLVKISQKRGVKYGAIVREIVEQWIDENWQ